MNNQFLPLRIICGSLLLLAFLHTSGRSQTTVPGWRSHTPLPLSLTGHRTLLLPTGDVLIAGGLTSDGTVTRTSYLYSPATGTFRPTLNQLITARAGHALIAVMVAGSARVFAIGGFGGTAGNYRGEGSVEMLEYDAAAGNWRWRGIGSLGMARGEPRAAWDGGSGIIVTGGYAQNGGAIRGGTRTTAADRIDIIGLSVQQIDPMSAARAEHVAARIIGENGLPQLLVAGGEDVPATTSTQLLRGTAWDPIANPPLAYHSAGIGVGDPAGVARVFGGFDGGGAPTGACEWYDVKRGWRAAPRMLTPRARFNATLVAGTADTVAAYLAAAGIGAGGALSGTELFQLPGASFPNGAWISFPSLLVAGSERDIAIVGDNLPLVSGGRDRSDAAIAETEIFQPFRASDLSFGDEEVGRRSDSTPVSIENEWLLPVRAEHFRIVGSAEFSFRGDTADFTLPAGGRRTIRLYFHPALAGPRDGLLLFDIGSITDTVRLSGRGIASQIGIINSPLDFGTELLGARRTECRYLLRNSGTDTSVIDSVVLAPPGSFRLISPIGRVAVAPGDSLRVCVEFAPESQGAAAAVATMYIAARSFPFQVIGRGIRRYLTASVISSECDTVLYAPGVEISGMIQLENRGDTVVHIDAPTLKAAAAGLFRFANPTIFPLDLPPGGMLQVEVIFSPQRESGEVAAVDFPNNGDTLAGASLCFIARSRYLSVSQSSVVLGSICLGDTATALITIENPGGFDSVDLRSATVAPSDLLTLAGFAPRTLGPREYLSLIIRYIPTAPGSLSGTLRIAGSRGDLIIPIGGMALTPARFTIRSGTMTIGDTITLPVDAGGFAAAATLNGARLTLEYDAKLLMPIDLVALPGGPALDDALSQLRVIGGGTAMMDLRWAGGFTGGPAFGIRCEALRGDGLLARAAIDGVTAEGLCVARSEATLALLPPCVGSSGFINADSAEFVAIAPSPASESIAVTLVTSADEVVDLEIVSTLGRVVAGRRMESASGRVRTIAIPVGELPTGDYFIRARAGARVIDARRLIIAR